MRVVVTGAAGTIGRRVVSRLINADPNLDVLAIDRIGQPSDPVGADTKRVDLATEDLTVAFAGAAVIVHLASSSGPESADQVSADLEVAIFRRVLDAATSVGASHIVVLSTAMVYGAWHSNPVPLTEDAPVRPNPDFVWAAVKANIEQMAGEWSRSNPKASAAILRPTAVVSDDDLGRLARVLHSARRGVAAEGDPPVQYLHVDDLASAVAVVVTSGFDGVANVAPDGWIPPDELHELEGPAPRIRVPQWAARALTSARWRLGVSPTPPGVVPYTSSSWVVSNDRIRALGWSPDHSNEEAWVVSHEAGPLDRMPAKRRQELALAAAVAAVLAALAAVAAIVVALRRR